MQGQWWPCDRLTQWHKSMGAGECKIQSNNQPVAPRYSHTIATESWAVASGIAAAADFSAGNAGGDIFSSNNNNQPVAFCATINWGKHQQHQVRNSGKGDGINNSCRFSMRDSNSKKRQQRQTARVGCQVLLVAVSL